MSKRRNYMKEAMRRELREHKSSFLVFSVLRALVIVSLVRQLWRGAMRARFSAR